ncbi:DUF3175 domain-containing protein [Bosea sp. BK604]|uniref:DUF3175 domain-containing protein n=1 Tax=Bosea sp. BK604 TaxID=2512180 RepID=UPI001052F0C6|nr:DUF3175 domain-containing protein [Bosea sp. BK604]TCR68359.1 uncharacterized protein DUF3175 [Bosea sp. BK604]
MAQSKRKWSGEVTRHSDALDLKSSVFKSDDPRRIAGSLKRSAEGSRRRKSSPFRSAMSMLTFYVNRAGRNLPKEKLRTLDAAKHSLRRLFHRE